MNRPVEALASPPPLPLRPPGLGGAVGLLALYFGLQLLLSVVVAIVLVLAVLVAHPDAASNPHTLWLRAAANADLRVAATAAALMAAAGMTLRFVRRHWPRQWTARRAWSGFGFATPSHGGFYALAVVVGLLTPMLGGLLTHWLAHGHPVPQDIERMGTSAGVGGRLALAVAAVTLGPLVEETMFRGVLLSALLGFHRDVSVPPSQARVATAMLLSAMLFGLVHLPDLGFLWYAIPNLVLLGIAAAWLRMRSGSIWPAVLAHATNNLLAVAGWFIATHPPG